MLARAFAQDPAMRWLFPDAARRERALPALFDLLLRSDVAAGCCEAAAAGASLAAWRAPGRVKVSAFDMLREAWPLARLFGPSLHRALALEAAIQRRHPAGAFWYLHILGTDPPAQGRGHAASLVRAGLARAAAEGVPVVLETATEANVALYRHLGFTMVAAWQVPRGPPFWTMRCDP